MKKALIIIDVQKFYFDEKGSLKLKNTEETSRRERKLLESFRKKKLPVIHVQHLLDRSRLNNEDTTLLDFHENVTPAEGEIIIRKRTPGSFNGTELLKILNDMEVQELVICGMMSQMCVDTTTREAFDLGFKCTVIHDACTTRDFEFNGTKVPAEYVHASAMAALGFAFAKVISVEDFLKELEK